MGDVPYTCGEYYLRSRYGSTPTRLPRHARRACDGGRVQVRGLRRDGDHREHLVQQRLRLEQRPPALARIVLLQAMPREPYAALDAVIPPISTP